MLRRMEAPTRPPGARAEASAETRLVARKHHLLVRITHWLNIPLLLGMVLSGLAIYWASPVYQHPPNARTGSTDYLADAGFWAVAHLPGQADSDSPENWFYDHFSLGHGLLADSLRFHWFFAYLFMANGLLYLIGLAVGEGYKALLPRRADMAGALRMMRYYAGVVPAKILRKRWPHPPSAGKYNSLQKAAYLSMPVFGVLAVATGWAIHKPAQLDWLTRLLGGYDRARIWHFWIMWVFVAFVGPHVILVVADGWDTFRSMVVGWSTRLRGEHE
jgi:thiosulfate reductase cytochrome b subunit